MQNLISFEYETGADMYIGSSNLSKSALTSGVEWNFRLDKSSHEADYHHYYQVLKIFFIITRFKSQMWSLIFIQRTGRKIKFIIRFRFQIQHRLI